MSVKNSTKQDLIDRIRKTDDPILIEEISCLLDNQEPKDDSPIELTPEQLTVIRQAKKDVRNGLFITHDDMVKMVRAWQSV